MDLRKKKKKKSELNCAAQREGKISSHSHSITQKQAAEQAKVHLSHVELGTCPKQPRKLQTKTKEFSWRRGEKS